MSSRKTMTSFRIEPNLDYPSDDIFQNGYESSQNSFSIESDEYARENGSSYDTWGSFAVSGDFSKNEEKTVRIGGEDIPEDSRRVIGKHWAHNVGLYHRIVDYYEKEGSIISPLNFSKDVPILNPLYTDYKLTAKSYMIDRSILDKSIIDNIDIDDIQNVYNYDEIKKYEGYESLYDEQDVTIAKVEYNNQYPFVVKSFPVILESTYIKYIMLNTIILRNDNVNSFVVDDDAKNLLMLVYRDMINDPWDIYYYHIYVNEMKIDDIYQYRLRKAFRQVRQSFTFQPSNDPKQPNIYIFQNYPDMSSLLLLRDFFKYMCLNMLLRSYSDANTEALIGILCNKLVTQKLTPGFALMYAPFKTLVNFDDNDIFELFKKESTIETLKTYSVPLQHIAMEYLYKTLDDLISEDVFNIKIVPLRTATIRYLDLIFQVATALFSAQNSLGYVHNDLHPKNIMLAPFEGPIVYYMNNNDLGKNRRLFNQQRFPRDDQGRIIFENVPQLGIYKIIDHGQASVIDHPNYIISDTPGLVAKTYGIDEYPMDDYNLDLLRFFVEIFDQRFYESLLKRINDNTADVYMQVLYNLFQQVFSCNTIMNGKETITWMFDVKGKQCHGDIDCQRIFDWFGIYGLGDGPKCEKSESATPENILKHFSIFCNPNIDIDKLTLKFNILDKLE